VKPSRYIKAIGKGMLKVMSKMGISTYQSYCGAQIFDAVGLSSLCRQSTSPAPQRMIEGVGLEEVARRPCAPPPLAFSNDPVLAASLDVGGEYAYRIRGEDHVWTPDAVATCSMPCAATCARTLSRIRRAW
jgi:glutamate synthase (NADPH/NADH) large chain